MDIISHDKEYTPHNAHVIPPLAEIKCDCGRVHVIYSKTIHSYAKPLESKHQALIPTKIIHNSDAEPTI